MLLNPANPIDWANQLAEALVAIHRIQPASTDRDLFPVLTNTDGHQSETETLAALSRHPLGMDLWSRRVETLAMLKPEVPVYVHSDFWPGNPLWVEEKLTEVVDWEGGSIADPALDVAYAVQHAVVGSARGDREFRRCLPGALGAIPRESALLGAAGPVPPDARRRDVGAGMAGDGIRHQRRRGPTSTFRLIAATLES